MTGTGFDSEKIDNFYRGEYSDDDTSYIDKVFYEDNNEKELKHLLSEQFDKLLSGNDKGKKNFDHILYKIHYDINTKNAEGDRKPVSAFLRWSVLIAGIIVIPLAVFWGTKGFINTSKGKETWVEIKAPAWTRAQFNLPDGTTGWLNSNSSIKYNGNFITNRQVTLHGEAFFDVFKDKTRPFKVNTDEIVVKVLGTRFNIASYDNEKDIEVVLEEGKLEFSDKDMNKSLVMNPDDMVIFDKTGKGISTGRVELKKYLSWTEGKLVFRNDPMDVIARRLERWYNIDVEVIGTFRQDLRLRATFVDEKLEEVLYMLKRSLPVDYRIEDQKIRPDETFTKKKVILIPKTK
jgi:transmembrane sensor